jgi:hypothetical protein
LRLLWLQLWDVFDEEEFKVLVDSAGGADASGEDVTPFHTVTGLAGIVGVADLRSLMTHQETEERRDGPPQTERSYSATYCG